MNIGLKKKGPKIHHGRRSALTGNHSVVLPYKATHCNLFSKNLSKRTNNALEIPFDLKLVSAIFITFLFFNQIITFQKL